MSPGLRKLGSIVALAAAGCSASVSPPTPVATVTLRPYAAPTLTPTATPSVAAPTVETTPRPTSTPFTHTIQKDETLLVIAAQYGISLEELLAANPGINPRLLSIGQQLIIPGPEGGQLIPELPTATPVPVELSEVGCYATISQDLICLASVSNPGDQAVEGVAVTFTLVGRDGEVLGTEQAYAPLNLLSPGGMLPVTASFSIPSQGGYVARATLLGAIPASHPEERYAAVNLVDEARSRAEDGRSWALTGRVELAEPSAGEIRRLVILAMGFDARGTLVGFAEAELDAGTASDGRLDYSLHLFSLGPPIEHVQTVAEATTSQ